MNLHKRKILVVDDHPMNMDAYINLINSGESEDHFIFSKATDCQTAYNIINQYKNTTAALDIALIDISIPKYEAEKLLSGTSLALLIRRIFPECIIIMLTMHSESLILYDIHKNVKPEGFISKNDIDFETFTQIFFSIINTKNYYSPTINDSIQTVVKQSVNWDDIDVQIILLLDKGIKTKDLIKYIDLSLSSIEKRKALLKRQVLDSNATDKELIAHCKLLKLI